MLKYEAIYPETLELLKKLMKLPGLDNFYLVGDTALALRIGHRISVDLDLFSHVEFSTQEFSTEELFDFYKLKYKSREMFHLVKSLVYFGEADLEPAPEMLIDVDWNNVKSFFNSLALKY